MFLARTDDECLGMLYAFRKPYLIGGQRTPCLEIFDWHSLPGLSGSGIGIRVMRAMTRLNERLIGIGGTPDAIKTLTAMGWQALASAVNFELPLRSEYLVEGLRRRVSFSIPGERLALSAAVATWFRPRRRFSQGDATPVQMLGADVDHLYEGENRYDLLQLPDRQWLQWLTSYPGIGSFRFWHFVVKGRLRGWGLTRVYQTAQGLEAAIVDLYAANPNVDTYTWMVSELATALCSESPLVIRARATCPFLQAALTNNRFRTGGAAQVFTWPKMAAGGDNPHITLNHTDACLRPYLPTDAATGSSAS